MNKRIKTTTIVDAIRQKQLFGSLPAFSKVDSWTAWLAWLKAIYALPMSPDESPSISNARAGLSRQLINAQEFVRRRGEFGTPGISKSQSYTGSECEAYEEQSKASVPHEHKSVYKNATQADDKEDSPKVEVKTGLCLRVDEFPKLFCVLPYNRRAAPNTVRLRSNAHELY